MSRAIRASLSGALVALALLAPPAGAVDVIPIKVTPRVYYVQGQPGMGLVGADRWLDKLREPGAA